MSSFPSLKPCKSQFYPHFCWLFHTFFFALDSHNAFFLSSSLRWPERMNILAPHHLSALARPVAFRQHPSVFMSSLSVCSAILYLYDLGHPATRNRAIAFLGLVTALCYPVLTTMTKTDSN